MTQVAAVGSGPVMFSSDDGTQIEVPMWEIYFDDGKIKTRRPVDASSVMLDRFLEYLAANGRLTAGGTPARTALEFVATNAGAYGNSITITTTTVSSASATRRVDITVSLTDRYPDLTVDDLEHLDDVLGTQTSKPGLMQATTPIPSNPTLPTPGEKPGTGTPPTSWTISGTGAAALKIEPRDPGAAFKAGTTVVTVEEGSAPQSVTLEVTWSATVRVRATDDLTTQFDSFGFLVELGDAPPDGFTLPRDGTVVLSGGSNTVDARAAKATLLTTD